MIKLTDALDEFLAYSKEKLYREIGWHIQKREEVEMLYKNGHKFRIKFKVKSKYKYEQAIDEFKMN